MNNPNQQNPNQQKLPARIAISTGAGL